MPRKPPTPERVYEIRSKVSGAVVGRQSDPDTARRECLRLNREAAKSDLRHLGVPVEYEVKTTTGVIL